MQMTEQINQEKVAVEEEKTKKAEFLRWFKPIILALRDLGGEASPVDTRKKIIENEQLSKEEISKIRGKTNVNKFENEVAFARNYLVKGGYIDNKVRGTWTLTETGMTVDMTEETVNEIYKKVVSEDQKKRNNGAAIADDDIDTVHYWLFSPGENSYKWEEFYANGIMAIGWGKIGNLEEFGSKDEIKAKMKEIYDSNNSYKNWGYAIWQFAKEIKIGDVIFVKNGRYQLVGRGIVTSDYEFDSNAKDDYSNIRKVN